MALSGTEARLIRRAILGRWPITAKERRRIVKRMVEVIEDPTASARSKSQAARVLVAADALNLKDELSDKPKRVEVTGKNGDPIEHKLGFDELRKLPPDELVRRHRAAIGARRASR